MLLELSPSVAFVAESAALDWLECIFLDLMYFLLKQEVEKKCEQRGAEEENEHFDRVCVKVFLLIKRF